MKLYWVTNIPSPYRNHRYRTMSRIFPKHGIDFEVLYMARTEPGRDWDMPAEQFAYPNTVFSGLHPVVHGWTGHFNPGLLTRLALDPPDVVLIGGFACPTHWLAPLFCSATVKRVMMVESNLDSARMMGRNARWFKRQMLLPNRAFIVPGPRSRDYILDVAPEVADRPFFELPNLVDESVWVDQVFAARRGQRALRARFGVPANDLLWICPARLIEEKGLHLFLPALEGLSGFRLLIAGEGPMRATLERQARDGRIPATFLGPQSEASMVALYAAADLFVLPSLRDASPLSAVEACAAGLPLLVSRRIGNLDDVLQEGINGTSFEVSSKEEVRESAVRALRWPSTKLQEMGKASSCRFLERFSSAARIEGLARFFVSVGSEGGGT